MKYLTLPYGYLHQKVIQTRLQNSQHAARSVSGEHSETGDYAIFSVDDPARLSKGQGHTRSKVYK